MFITHQSSVEVDFVWTQGSFHQVMYEAFLSQVRWDRRCFSQGPLGACTNGWCWWLLTVAYGIEGGPASKTRFFNFGALFVGKRWHRFSVNQRGFPKATDGCQLTTAVFGSHVKGTQLGRISAQRSQLEKLLQVQLQCYLFSDVFRLSYYEFSPTNFMNPIDGVPSTLGRPKNHMSVHALEALRGSDSGGFSKSSEAFQICISCSSETFKKLKRRRITCAAWIRIVTLYVGTSLDSEADRRPHHLLHQYFQIP